MGIQGLLVGLKPFTQQGNLMDYADQSLAVDTSSWMHKSIYSIANHYVECQEAQKIDERCIQVSTRYLTQRCRELHDGFRIGKIYLVMDGKRCPLKAITNQERDDRRQENLRLARQYRKQNRIDASFEKYKSCIKIVNALTIPVVKRVAKLLKYVELVWSPYEADAQLAQMCIDGRSAACITEDSDVLVYSAAAQVSFPIIYKLDRTSGNADIVSMDWLLDSSDVRKNETTTKDNQTSSSQLGVVLSILQSRQKQIPGWGARLFVMGCVLAGCDYAPRQILGVGLVKAFKLVREAGITGSDKNLAKIFRYILSSALNAKSRGSVKDSDALEEQLSQAEAVFYYHPVQRNDGRIVHFTSHEIACAPKLERFADCSFLGSLVANENEDPGIIPKCFRMKSANIPPAVLDKKGNVTSKKPGVCNKKNPQATPPRKCRVLQSPSSATSSLSSPSMANGFTGKNGVIPNFVTACKASKNVVNPYTKSGQHELRRKNAFESYKRRHENPEKIDRIRQIVQTKLPVRRHPEKDVRGVKRKFPKLQADGTYAALPVDIPKRSRFEKDPPDDPPNEPRVSEDMEREHRRRVVHHPANDARHVNRPIASQKTSFEHKRLGFEIDPPNEPRVSNSFVLCDRDWSQDVDQAHTTKLTGINDAAGLSGAFEVESPFFSKKNNGSLFGSKDLVITAKRPDPSMDRENLFVPSSPNLLLEPSQEEDDEVKFLEVKYRDVRRVTMAQPPAHNKMIRNRSFDFYDQSCSNYTPAATRPRQDDTILDQQRDNVARDNDDIEVLDVHRNVRTPQGLNREQSTNVTTKKRPLSSGIARLPFRHLKSFLTKDRKRRTTKEEEPQPRQRQSSILSHFKFR